MNTYITYFDETGDDGANTQSSKEFVLTSAYMNSNLWQDNYNKIRECRKNLKDKYGLHISEELHTKHLVRDKGIDEGRLPPMRKTARAIRVYNPVLSHYGGTQNIPIKGLIEDILAKESTESYFIQLCDFVSFFADLYFRIEKGEQLPKRVGRVIDATFVKRVFATFKSGGVLNLKASNAHDYGFVIYPK